MRIDLDRIQLERIPLDDAKSGPVQWKDTLQLDASTLENADIVALSPIETSGELARAEPNFRLRGSVAYEQTLNCYRCLEEFSSPVDSDFEYVLQRDKTKPKDDGEEEGSESSSSSGAEGGFDSEIRLDQADLEVLSVAADEIDPVDYIREQVILQVPMKPLCRSDCKGLCSKCGTDLNSGECSCETVVADPRWAGLESLKDSLSDS